jgi:hypothetical protein
MTYLVVFERGPADYRGLLLTSKGQQIVKVIRKDTREAVVRMGTCTQAVKLSLSRDPSDPTIRVIDASGPIPEDLARAFTFLWGPLYERSPA